MQHRVKPITEAYCLLCGKPLKPNQRIYCSNTCQDTVVVPVERAVSECSQLGISYGQWQTQSLLNPSTDLQRKDHNWFMSYSPFGLESVKGRLERKINL